jgi:hypothetical protein
MSQAAKKEAEAARKKLETSEEKKGSSAARFRYCK